MLDSKMECRVHNVLTDAGIPFTEEHTFGDLISSSGRHLRFDFCVFDDEGNIDFLIECNGKQHYSPVSKFGGRRGLYRQQYNDNLKRKYCAQHHLRLVTIPYFDEDRIDFQYIMHAAGYY